MPPLELTPDELAEALTAAELEVVGRMRYSSNATFLVEARLDGEVRRAVYKPRGGERPLWDFPSGTLCQREVAAYELSRGLGWGIVPVTVLRDGPFGPGAVQRFVEHDPDDHYFTLLARFPDRFRAFAQFDVVANNTDRKGGHCLLDLEAEAEAEAGDEAGDGAAGRAVVGIDHGLTFHPDWKLRTVIWDFEGERPAEPQRVDLCRVLEELDGGPLAGRLAPLLDADEIEAVAMRTRMLLERGLPEYDGGHHSVPWPLV